MHKTAGFFFFLSGAVLLMGIVSAEIFYPPPYSIANNMISNLGSTPPPDSIIHQPSAAIFDTALFIAGACILLGLFAMKRKFSPFLCTMCFLGLGTMGVGLFPAYHVVDHPVAALIAFASGGMSAAFSAKVTKGLISFTSVALGSVSLFFLLSGLFLPQLVVPLFGKGGTERFVAYPIILWLVSFGGYLLSKK